MSCRTSKTTSGILTVMRMETGLRDPQAISLFHDEMRKAKTIEGLEEQMTDGRAAAVRGTVARMLDGLVREGQCSRTKGDEIVARLQTHSAPDADPRVRYAQATVIDRGQRARVEINRAIRDAASATGRQPSEVEQEFWQTWDEAHQAKTRAEDREALIEQYPHAPHDEATLVALAHLARPAPPRELRVRQFTVRAVGVSAMPGYPSTLHALLGREAATGRKPRLGLKREPDNAHDPNAIAVVDDSGRPVAYLPRDMAARLAPVMDRGEACDVGSWRVMVDPVHEDRPGLEVEVKRHLPEPSPPLSSSAPGRSAPPAPAAPSAPSARPSSPAAPHVPPPARSADAAPAPASSPSPAPRPQAPPSSPTEAVHGDPSSQTHPVGPSDVSPRRVVTDEDRRFTSRR